MGEANRKGTYEQRKALAIARRKSMQDEADAKCDREYAERMRMKMSMRRTHGLTVNLLGAALAASTIMSARKGNRL